MKKETRLRFRLYDYLSRAIFAPFGYVLHKDMYKIQNSDVPYHPDYVRIKTLELCTSLIREKNVHGAVAELGVYRGGFAKYISRLNYDRELYLFDTFTGFSEVDVKLERQMKFSEGDQSFSNTSVEYVLKQLDKRQKVTVRKGYFPETAVGLEAEEFALVSIDVDLYNPIVSGIKYFWPRTSRGGFIFVHDYNNPLYPGVKKAVNECVDAFSIPLLPIPDNMGTVVLAK
jgi:O-methyltransferase